MTDKFQGPSWDLSDEYQSLTSDRLNKDFARAQKLLEEINFLSQKVVPYIPKDIDEKQEEKVPDEVIQTCQKISGLKEEAAKLIIDLRVYASCVQAVDGKNQEAKTFLGKVAKLGSELGQAANPVNLFLTLCSKEAVEKYLADPKQQSARFVIENAREMRDTKLPLDQEDLIMALKVDGFSAWDTLYGNISGVLSCELELPEGGKKVGLAEAQSYAEDSREEVRKEAFTKINQAWETQEESCAAVLNSLAGWRLELNQRRSQKRKLHFLDLPLHGARITRQTLDAMFGAVADEKASVHNMLRLKAKHFGKKQIGPWDRFAPAPAKASGCEETKYTFDEAINIIKTAFSTVHQDMADFVDMMVEKKWIEATVGANKRPGAYCTEFYKSMHPRVYMTYTGGMSKILTLAHELGHAFHCWVMRDIPYYELHYPMTLAETASIFSETLVMNYLLEIAKNEEERFKLIWEDMTNVDTYLLHIPVRFDFETNFYELRKTTKLTPDRFKELTLDAWKKWYGDILQEGDPMLWASKLHFHKAGINFYNFPYTFGYLFSMGVLSQKEKMGTKFFEAYKALLRDTGRMVAEKVAKHHLNVDIEKKQFWAQSLGMVKQKMKKFEEMDSIS